MNLSKLVYAYEFVFANLTLPCVTLLKVPTQGQFHKIKIIFQAIKSHNEKALMYIKPN